MIRTDKISGLITVLFGIALIVFASQGLGIIAIQRIIFTLMHSFPVDADGTAKEQRAFDAVHGVLAVYFPVMFLIGVIFAFTGYRIRTCGSILARRIAQGNTMVACVALAAYLYSCMAIIEDMRGFGVFPEPAHSVVMAASFTTSALMAFPFIVGMFFVLTRPSKQRPTDSHAA